MRRVNKEIQGSGEEFAIIPNSKKLHHKTLARDHYIKPGCRFSGVWQKLCPNQCSFAMQ